MPCPPAWSLPPSCIPVEWHNMPPFEAIMPCEHNPVSIFPNAFTYISINGEQVMTLGAVSLVAHTSGVLPIDRGGTGGTTPEQARINLGLGSSATQDSSDYATAAQGALADSAMQPGDDAAGLGSGAATEAAWVLTADGSGNAGWAPGASGVLPTATQAEMEAGTEAGLRAMSPLLARQGEDARFASPPVLGSMTPNRVCASEVWLDKAGGSSINYERLSLQWSGDTAQIAVGTGGAGTFRALHLVVGDKPRFEILADSYLLWRPSSALMDGPTYGTNLLTAGGWTVGTGWTESPSGTFTHTSGGGTATLSHSASVATNTSHLCSYTITGRTTGSVTISFGGRSLAGVTASGGFGPTTANTTGLVVAPTNDFNGSITLTLVPLLANISAYGSYADSSGTNRLAFRIPAVSTSLFWGNGAGSRASTFSSGNAGFGNIALQWVTTGLNNTGIGINALASCMTGNNNVGLGYDAGRYAGSGTTRLENSIDCVFVGAGTRANADNINNCVAIGAGVTGLGSNTTIIGNSNITKTRLQGTVETGGDFESTTSGSGVFLKSPNGTRYHITVNNSGAIIATPAP